MILKLNLRKINGTRSCGCISSKGEKAVGSILIENNIRFIKRKSIGLVFDGGGKAIFDFIIMENNTIKYIIEYDGQQHYDDNNSWNKNKKYRGCYSL